MAEFSEVMEHFGRMCNSYTVCSRECPMFRASAGLSCKVFTEKHPEKAEQIIMDWAKEYPLITNRDKFKEVFGVELNFSNSGCCGFACPPDIKMACNMCPHKDFWNKEYKGE